jgi:hypothetical protein
VNKRVILDTQNYQANRVAPNDSGSKFLTANNLCIDELSFFVEQAASIAMFQWDSME